MLQNVSRVDRVVRGVLGIWLLVVALAAYLNDQHTKVTTAAIAGAGLLVN